MKIKFLTLLFFLLALPVFLHAQQGDTNSAAATNSPATNTPVTNAEEDRNSPPKPGSSAQSNSSTNATEEMTDEADAFTPGLGGIEREVVFKIGGDVDIKSNDVARTVVVIGGNIKIHGKVREAVVAIGGDIEVDGQVRDATVAVLGDIRAGKGARLNGEVVAVGGKIESADDVKMPRSPVEIDFGGLGKSLRLWVFQCVFKLRPLAPQVGWVWAVWAAFFLVYLLVALILPTPVRACASELTKRPATTFFMGLLTKILLPLVITILSLTVIGAIVVPFFLAALLFGAIVGKVALFEFFGAGLSQRLGTTFLQNSIIAFLIGILVVTLLYMVPVLGLITFGVVSVWGLGGAVTAAFWGLKREMPEKTVNQPLPVPASPPDVGASMPINPGPGAATESIGMGAAVPGAAPASTIPANVPEAYAYPRAGFWERMGAAFLDLILMGIIMAAIHKPPLAFLAALAYFSGMWAWKGTTIGGVVLGLKVVRLDGYPVTFLISIVRGLAAAFSVVVFFLGFLWIIFDREKQGWHDKIAGTAVIKLPKGTPLVMF